MEPLRDDGDRLRVSDREREQVVELLGQAAAEGRLTLDEYADRAGTAHAARTRGELAKLTEDLPYAPPGDTSAAGGLPAPVRPSPAPVNPSAPVRSGADSSSERLVAIFGDESRKGNWLVPQRVEARAVFGDCRIELQDAHLQHQVTVIDATAIFGSVVIVVPEGLDVRLSGMAVFGDKKSKLHGPVTPGAPVIEVHCNVIFGSVSVRPPRKRWW